MTEVKLDFDILKEIERIKQAEEANRLEITRLQKIAEASKRAIYQRRIAEERPEREQWCQEFYRELRHLGIIQMIARATSVPAWLWDGDCKTLEPENQPEGPTLDKMTAKQRRKFYNSPEWNNRVLTVNAHRTYQVKVLRPSLDPDILEWSAPLRIRAISTRKLFERDRFYDLSQYQPYIEVSMDIGRNLTITGQEVSEVYLPLKAPAEEAQLLVLKPLARAFVHPFKPERPPTPRIDPNLVIG